MGAFAENQIEIDQALYYEGVSATSGPAYRRTALRFLALIAVLLAVVCGVLIWSGGNLWFVIAEIVLIALISVWMLVLYPRKRARKGFAAMRSKNGGNMKRSILFYDTSMRIEAGSGEVDLPYTDVLDMITTKNLYIFNCKGKNALLLSRRGFVRGDIETVCKQIKKEKDAAGAQ